MDTTKPDESIRIETTESHFEVTPRKSILSKHDSKLNKKRSQSELVSQNITPKTKKVKK